MGGKCEISHKRIDRQWGPWGESIQIIETNTSYVEYVTREVSIDYAHGGINGTEGPELVLRSLIWVREGRSWLASKAHCESLGGKLFYNVDGTESQLMFFAEKLNYHLFWLGIYTKDHVDWLTVDDYIISDPDLLNWKATQPQNAYGDSNYVSSEEGVLSDDREYHKMYSICDMS